MSNRGPDRRTFLRAGAGGVGVAALAAAGCAPEFVAPPNGTPFTLGVMSGLHSHEAVVLWTRLEPSLAPGVDSLDWVLSTSSDLTRPVAGGTVAVGQSGDFTAKVLVDRLDPGHEYWYRFEATRPPSGRVLAPSPVGRARTLPSPGSSPGRVRLAFASCQNWGYGWYNAWDAIATDDLDAVVFLGDYIYETTSFALTSVRKDPLGTVSTLDGYRAKYRLYRSDPSLQAGHAAHPFVPIWDDHEFHDGYNRLDVEGDPLRAAAAYRAWFEYMPVWPIDGTRIYRNLRWGSLANLSLLDTRQYRDRQANGFQGPGSEPFVGAGQTIVEAAQPGRTILGATQRDWLYGQLEEAQAAGVPWKLIGNQVMIAPLRGLDFDSPDFRRFFPDGPPHDGVYFGMDSWQSYLWERDQVLGYLADRGIENVSFMTGDIHSFWQMTMRADMDDERSPRVANEFVTGSISSPGVNVIDNDDLANLVESAAAQWVPAFNYTDHHHNGYGIVDARPDAMSVTYRTTKVRERGVGVRSSMRFDLQVGEPTVTLTRVG
ncbi:MAG: alkaline phosphatase D family protein [Microthrixaceae bacterium]